MIWYKNKLFPWIMQKNIGKKSILLRRQEILSKAYGNILEIGIGTGINISLYPNTVTELSAIDSYIRDIPISSILVKLVNESVDNMSYEDNYFDTIISTFSLCSVTDLNKTLSEIYRVLKPGGQFLFLEHGKSQNKIASIIQNIFNPLYNIFAYGCNINRSYMKDLAGCGFETHAFSYEVGPIYPKILTGYIYSGIAKKPKEAK